MVKLLGLAIRHTFWALSIVSLKECTSKRKGLFRESPIDARSKDSTGKAICVCRRARIERVYFKDA